MTMLNSILRACNTGSLRNYMQQSQIDGEGTKKEKEKDRCKLFQLADGEKEKAKKAVC